MLGSCERDEGDSRYHNADTLEEAQALSKFTRETCASNIEVQHV